MIEAKIIAASVSPSGKRITTFELEYPRFVHSEIMTHRLFSRNAASSRAIPIKEQLERVYNEPAMPVHWGKNQSGMQAENELSQGEILKAKNMWVDAARSAVDHAKKLDELGVHKQIVNRITEPFVNIRTVITSTEFDNFWWLRNHKDAQPELGVLAKQMFLLYESHVPYDLDIDEWHTPYFNEGYWSEIESRESLEEALSISASCCAQVSYRKLDDSVEKAGKIFNKLVESEPMHFSPMEHQATPINEYVLNSDIGITHIDQNKNMWSGNFKGWIQHRKIIMEDRGLKMMEGDPK